MPLVSAGIGSSVKPDALLEVKHDTIVKYILLAARIGTVILSVVGPGA